MRTRHVLLFALSSLLIGLAACGPAPAATKPATDVTETLRNAVDNLEELQTFGMTIAQLGADYPFAITLDQGASEVVAVLLRGEAEYVAPDEVFVNVKLRAAGLTVAMDLYADGFDQWMRLPGTEFWIDFPFAEDFNPGQILSRESGIEWALGNLTEVDLIGDTTLIDGTPVHHIQGMATGEVVNAILFGLMSIESDEVVIDAYVSRDAEQLVRLDVTLPGSATADAPDTVWSLELYDFDQPTSFDRPVD
jgi:hypothetical protein